MSLIVGIEHQGAVYMGADCGGWRSGFEDPNATPKLFRLGPLLTGCSGDLRAHNILQHCLDELPPLTGEPERYLVRELVPRLQDALTRHRGCKTSDGQDIWGGGVLVGVAGELFQLSAAYCVFRNTRGYAATGADSAMGVALGVLSATPDKEPPARIVQALSAAVDHTDYARAPFTLAELPAATAGLHRVA